MGALGLFASLGPPAAANPDSDRASLVVAEGQRIEVEIQVWEGTWTTISPGNEIEAMPRTYRMRWRSFDSAAWQDLGIQQFAPGRTYEFSASDGGLLVRDTARPGGEE
ncbi:hypothetical protein [Paraliomyxa miuraensis]|uniref:hypothetical protein n=1 Tax=Paraliomyxa miuraensis TaxID=376150 RepID=UPI002255EE5D|nr:hypothetical protein [Paraliomyxa miuraensis]MCX4239632.1 hypothetical protein [Paraliomyxa miuraensis]